MSGTRYRWIRLGGEDMKESEKLKEIFNELKEGEKFILRETEENTYIKKKKSMQMISSKRIETELINRDLLKKIKG